MQYRVARAISKAVVAAGTAGAIATACWLLTRILDDSKHKRVANTSAYIDVDEAITDDDMDDGEYDRVVDNYHQQFEEDAGDSFALLPVVSESDDESEALAMGYTGDFFTPRHDVCMLSVSVQTQVDSLSHVPPSSDPSDCRLCRAAVERCDPAAVAVGEKPRALSFSETDSSSNGSVLSIASDTADDHEEDPWQRRERACSRTEQWLRNEICYHFSTLDHQSMLARSALSSICHMPEFKSREVAKSFQASAVSDGDEALVNHSTGSSRLRNFDPFLFLDKFRVALPTYFPDNPH
ncbi:pirin-like protein [Phytophthora cinnamomi]|uniref:pirin-like protein n=1 Tax=Phytophthora cinnamomi TaxID=4785 RepID=UPI00355A5DB6|nr:pirin-like protein [Phytophthora cinnamomi]